jgi:hypothetical protein
MCPMVLNTFLRLSPLMGLSPLMVLNSRTIRGTALFVVLIEPTPEAERLMGLSPGTRLSPVIGRALGLG